MVMSVVCGDVVSMVMLVVMYAGCVFGDRVVVLTVQSLSHGASRGAV